MKTKPKKHHPLRSRCPRCFMLLISNPHDPDQQCPITPAQKNALAIYIKVAGRSWLDNLLADRHSLTLSDDLHRLVRF